MSVINKLQNIAKDFRILYVEDNNALRNNAEKLLKKFFSQVDLAENGQVGLEKFKEHHYSIVITDIKMPKLDGITLIKHIKQINPDTKTIIMSAFDDKALLLQGIELGVFRFLKKPVNITELSNVLYTAILEIKHEQNVKIFYRHLKNIFDYQSSMVVMLNNTDVILANDMFLEFFGYESLQECQKNIGDIGDKFLEHDGFLYNYDGINPLQSLQSNVKKLYHIKLKDKDSNIRHFIGKYQEIPEKSDYGVLSFDDITELNLLKLFDEKQTSFDTKVLNTKAMFSLLDVIQKNNAKIELHNFYEGLSVTHDGVITDILDDVLTLKTTYMQQKAIQLEQKTLIVSSALPHTIECNKILKINFEKQEVTTQELSFVKKSPIDRETIRVTPSGKVSLSLFLGENKFYGDIELEDISLNAVRLKLLALPAGLDEISDITLDIVLELNKKPLIIHTGVTFFRKYELEHSFHVVFLFEEFQKSDLVKYITKRQMELIREIKGMQNG